VTGALFAAMADSFTALRGPRDVIHDSRGESLERIFCGETIDHGASRSELGRPSQGASLTMKAR